MFYYKAMLSLIWIVSCILIADALLRPGEEFSFMFLVYIAFITNTALATKKNHLICLLDYVCLHLVCGREGAQGTKDSSSCTCWQLRGNTWCSAPCRPCSPEQSHCPLAATQPCWGGLSWRDRRWLPAQPGHTRGQQPLAPLLTTAPLLPEETSIKIQPCCFAGVFFPW